MTVQIHLVVWVCVYICSDGQDLPQMREMPLASRLDHKPLVVSITALLCRHSHNVSNDKWLSVQGSTQSSVHPFLVKAWSLSNRQPTIGLELAQVW